jgi:hypothetical protein
LQRKQFLHFISSKKFKEHSVDMPFHWEFGDMLPKPEGFVPHVTKTTVSGNNYGKCKLRALM